MTINYKLIEAIQAIAEVGKTVENLEYAVQELEQDVSHWRNTANELERKLESAEKACANEADSCDKIEAKLVETLKVNENLRVARNEECTKYERVCGELTETKELLERANTEVGASRARIKELETELSAALTANWTEAVVPKLTAPEPEVIEEPTVNPEDLVIVAEDGLKRDYYFRLARTPMPGTTVTLLSEVSKIHYARNSGKQPSSYISYHESPSTARNNKFMDLVEMYPPTGYAIEFDSEADKQAYSFAKGKYKALNTAQPAIALASTKAEGEANE